MKAYKFLFIIAILFQNIFAVNAVDKTKSFKVSPGGQLTLEVNSGEIRITTWDKNEVQVTVKGLYDEDSDNLRISEDQNNISVKYYGGWSESDELMFVVSIPVRYNQDLRTLSGDISLSGNVKGFVKAFTNGGDVKTGSIEGNAELNSQGGDITSGDITGDAELITQGGDIFTGSISGKAELNTMGGDITAGDINKNANIKTMGGDIRTGKIGGASEILTYGGDVKLKYTAGNSKITSMGGDVYLDGAKGVLKVSTQGGDLKLLDITGSVDAYTASGDIIVDLVPENTNSSKIITQDGGLTFRIPDRAKAEITALIRNSDSDDEKEEVIISSDFKSNSHSQTSNTIKDVFVLNGGGVKIYLESNNSGIKIRKLIR